MRIRNALAGFLLLHSVVAWPADLDACPGGAASGAQRYLAVISDLHIGNGRQADGNWHRQEDFRWDGALRTFLERIDQCAQGRADLVIAGDLLELWQPLPGLRCRSDKGCTVEEMVAITGAVLKGHAGTLRVLRDFAGRGDNRIHVVPGNHDAALLLPEVWGAFERALGAAPGRMALVKDGLWLSSDRVILVEHGHQIGSDVNRYDAWPEILRDGNGQRLIVQPWGENFVQAIFNAEEDGYPIIDNLSPEAAGVRYRMADRGLWRSAKDMARFVAFNLFETSVQQKGAFLGKEDKTDPKWDVTLGRQKGHLLYANALAADDPFRLALLADDEAGASLRAELDALARDPGRTSDAEIALLCDHVAIRGEPGARCERPRLGATAQKILVPRRRVMSEHLRGRVGQPGLENVRVFIYGHTHMLEEAWTVDVNAFVRMTVLNSGAFQRVVDEEAFLARVRSRPNLTPAEALRSFQPEDLAPCYTSVLVPYEAAAPRPQTVRWLALEGAPGQFVTAGDARCR